MTNASYTRPPFPCSIVVIKTTGQLGKTFKFEKKDWCVLGANEDCDIIVPFPGVAQLQALIHVKRDGVFLQGIDKQLPVLHPRLHKQLLNEEEVLLLPGDTFFLGERKFLIEYSPEEATFESSCNSIRNAGDSNQSANASTNPRTVTPRSNRAQKKKRKSSLVVGEFDEKYVSPRKGSEKLLSKTQLARISNSEFDSRPANGSYRNLENQVSSSGPAALEDGLLSSEKTASSSSSDESTVMHDLQDRVSRSIDFSAVDNDLANRQINAKHSDAAHPSLRPVPSQDKRDIVFARLSKGLSATPRRGETTVLFGRNNTIEETVLGYSSAEAGNVLTGKENVPQLCTELSEGFNVTDRAQGVDVNRVRSPLSNRAETENQTVFGLNQGKTPRHTNRMWDASREKSSIQTPRGRSVAFARNIELAAGAHYSPFRLRQVANQSRGSSKSKKKSQSRKKVRSAKSSKVHGHLPVGSTHRKPKQRHSTKSPDQDSALVSTSDGVRTSCDSKEVSRDATLPSTQPVLEYEDDSDPPTPSSTGEEPESNATQAPDPSPMARVGGALAAFLSRLSGTLESDAENDSSPENDEPSSFKALSLTKSQETNRKQTFHPTEPVMSASEVKELSCAMPPAQKKAFVSQVESAAADVRQAMQPVSDDPDKTPSSPSGGTFEVEETTWDVLVTAEIQSSDPVVSAEEAARAEGSGSKDPVPSQEEITVQQNSTSMGSGYSTESEQTTFCESEPSASESYPLDSMEAPSHSGTEEDVEDRSISLEEYPNLSVGDSEDLETKNTFLSGAKNFNQPDLRYEESEGDEIDYGDEDDEASMESSDREIAAVVIDGDEEDAHGLHMCSDDHMLDDNHSPEDGQNHDNDRAAQCANMGYPRERSDTSEGTQRTQFMHTGVSSDASGDIREQEDASASIVDGMRKVVAPSIACDSPAAARVRTEIEAVGEAVIPDQVDTVEDDKSKNAQYAIPPDTSTPEDTSTHISDIRKELSRFKKDELKARLVAHGLDTGGLKKDLVERLALHIVEETTSSKEKKTEKQLSTPVRQGTKKEHPDIPPKSSSRRTLQTPGASSPPPNSGETDLAAQDAHLMVRRSARKKRTQAPVIIDLEAMSPTDTSQLVPEPQIEVEADSGPDLSLYRKHTVKELRQFLKNRGLDIQQKMRKEDLIQHLISLSIGSDGSPIVKESDGSAEVEESELQCSDAEPPSSTVLTSHQRMTVTQLRAQLKSRGQCQTGTKKILLERLSSLPERRTRSRRTGDATSCSSRRTGKVLETNGKR